jgi:Inner membrane protein YgaP-like, transmembrane domain
MNTRWSVNITPVERVARILIGLTGGLAGGFLLAGAGSVVVGALELLLILAGLDLIVTGATGRPLYKKLGYVPTSLKGRTS